MVDKCIKEFFDKILAFETVVSTAPKKELVIALADHHPARIPKSGKDFMKKVDFKDIKFPVENREIHKIKKYIYVKYPIYA